MPVPERRGLITRALLRENAYRSILNAIVQGTLAPGERLHDAELAQWLGVSRTPVREALTRLEDSGLVQTKPGRYTMVSPLDGRTARAAQTVTAAMHELAVRQATSRLSVGEIDTMRVANARFAVALRDDDVDAAIAADDEFHGVAVRAAANPVLSAVIDKYTPVLRRVERLRFPSFNGRASVAAHDRIVTLCEAGDVEGAAAAARDNWLSLSEVFDL